MVKAIGTWFTNVMRRLVMGALYEFWRDQSKKLIEAIKRESPRNVQEPLKMHIPASPIVLDTSSIIDGRIIGVIKSGFLDGMIVVPQNVVDELQYMADKSNNMKRQKGRRGLDLLKEIKDAAGRKKFVVVNIKSKPEDVDKSLINYCKKNHARIATVDFNLNKAAQVNGVVVLNINNLANEVKTNILPGEILTVTPIQEGKEPRQTLAYLEDGTMIVVKDSAEYIGKEKKVVVEKILQTSAGRMIFATIMQSS